jgi:predicted ATPase
LRDLRATGAELRLPYYLGLLAQARTRAGRHEAAAETLAEGFEVAERNAESWTLPSLHLIEGELLLTGPPAGRMEAEACFRRAATIARDQGAIALVLRATAAVCRFWAGRGQRSRARNALAPIYAKFTEGLDSSDLIEAKALLDSLQ